MHISKSHKTAFIAIPKTGTRAIYSILEKFFASRLLKEHGNELPDWAEKYYIFTSVRNPYSRAVSLWWSTTMRTEYKKKQLKKYGKDTDLLSFLKLLNEKKAHKLKIDPPLLKTQSYWLSKFSFDKILRFEHLEADFLSIPFIKEAHISKLPKANVTTPNKVSQNLGFATRTIGWEFYIGKEEAELIEKYYADDFKCLSYDKLNFG